MTKGRGYILVEEKLWPVLGSPHTPQEWASSILLPEDYKVVSVDHHETQPLFRLHVESSRIPVRDTPTLLHVTHRIDNGVVSFDHIDLIERATPWP